MCWVERLADIWGGAVLGWRSICPIAVALAVTFVVTRIVLVASAEEEKHIARRLG